jgi:hypothetical protein
VLNSKVRMCTSVGALAKSALALAHLPLVHVRTCALITGGLGDLIGGDR